MIALYRERLGFRADDLPAASTWRTGEVAILRRLYPTGGTAACLPHLPTRSKAAIQGCALRAGIRYVGKDRR